MPELAERTASPLARFAEFYEEVARLKLAIRDGRLALYLAAGRTAAPENANDLAAMTSQRLKQRLQEQGRIMRRIGTAAEINAYRVAQYVMAALADEVFILDTQWSGRDAWELYLLERGLFGTDSAGRRFFDYLEQLLKSRSRTPLTEDLAAVFLIALQLGFKGQYRGGHGAPVLESYREKLIQFIGAGHASLLERPGFPQAYQYRISETRDARLAPLSRWYRIGAVGAAVYVAVSTLVWVAVVNRFEEVFGVH